MLRRISIILLMFCAFAGLAPLASAQIIQINTPAAAPTSQPTSQPAQTTAAAPSPQQQQAERKKLLDSLYGTQLGQIIQGERTLTWSDVKDPMFWIDNIKDLVVTILGFIPRVLGTIIFLFVFWLIYRGIRRMAMGSMKKSEVDSSIREMLGTLIRWAVMGFGVVIACNQLGIPIVAMLTGVSIIGLAVGFAAQETLANFIAGIVIFLDKPFKIGDWVQIDGAYGQVKRVSFRSTRLINLDGEVIVFPNTQVLSTKLSNHSTNAINRVNVPIGIAYKESISRAREVLLEITKNDTRLVKEPAPEVVVKECADSSVNLLLRFWIADEAVERKIGYEYNEKAKEALDAAGIEIPFPHLQLLLENTPAVTALAGNGERRSGNGVH